MATQLYSYRHHAEQATNLQELIDHLEAIRGVEKPPSKVLYCEELPRNQSQVSTDALDFTLARLNQWKKDEEDNRGRFGQGPTGLPPFLRYPEGETPTNDNPPKAEAVPAKRRRKRKVL